MVYIGEIVNTHGIKGELRIISDFKYKKEAFAVGNHVYLGKRKQEKIIASYRKHKNFDMVTFEGVNDINEAIIFKGDDVFIKRCDLDIDGFVDEDIIGLSVMDNNEIVGTVDNIIKNKQELLVIKNKDKSYMIPFVDELIRVDLENKRLILNNIEGLIDEN